MYSYIEEARLEKILKYQPLADPMRRRGYSVHIDGFVVGALRAWHLHNNHLRVSSGYAGLMR